MLEHGVLANVFIAIISEAYEAEKAAADSGSADDFDITPTKGLLYSELHLSNHPGSANNIGELP